MSMMDRQSLDIALYEERVNHQVDISDATAVSSISVDVIDVGAINPSGEWVPVGLFDLTAFGEFYLSNRSVRSVATRRYGFISGATAGTDFGAGEANKLGLGLEDVGVILSDIFGTTGFVKSTHYNATVIPGDLALSVSRGSLNVGDAEDGWVWVMDDETFILDDDLITDGSITANTTNWFFLKTDGTWAVRNGNSPPANSMAAFTAVADAGGTEFTSVNNLPAGRVNIDTYYNTRTMLGDRHFSGTVNTIDATVTTLLSFTPDDGDTTGVRARVVARQSDGKAAYYLLAAVFKRVGSTVTQIGSTTVISSNEETAGWDAAFSISGTSVLLRVTGAASANINWKGRITTDEVA